MERGSSVVECRTRNRESTGSNRLRVRHSTTELPCSTIEDSGLKFVASFNFAAFSILWKNCCKICDILYSWQNSLHSDI